MAPLVIAVVDDLFFASRIRAAAERAGARLIFAKSTNTLLERVRDEMPALIIADLNANCCDPIELARALKDDERGLSVPLVGFFAHVQTELQRAASEAGFDRVMPRSAFTKQLDEILVDTVRAQDTA